MIPYGQWKGFLLFLYECFDRSYGSGEYFLSYWLVGCYRIRLAAQLMFGRGVYSFIHRASLGVQTTFSISGYMAYLKHIYPIHIQPTANPVPPQVRQSYMTLLKRPTIRYIPKLVPPIANPWSSTSTSPLAGNETKLTPNILFPYSPFPALVALPALSSSPLLPVFGRLVMLESSFYICIADTIPRVTE